MDPGVIQHLLEAVGVRLSGPAVVSGGVVRAVVAGDVIHQAVAILVGDTVVVHYAVVVGDAVVVGGAVIVRHAIACGIAVVLVVPIPAGRQQQHQHHGGNEYHAPFFQPNFLLLPGLRHFRAGTSICGSRNFTDYLSM